MSRTKTMILNDFNINKQKMKALKDDFETLIKRAYDVNDFLGLFEVWDKNDVYKKKMEELALEQRTLIIEYSNCHND